MPLTYGCVADDFTGATDLAGNLADRGIRTAVVTGGAAAVADAAADRSLDAIVVALKTRTAPAATAVDESIAAFRALGDAGAERLYFKYCSTFDSTPAGNIGPVLDAALGLAGGNTIVVPSFPANGRTVRDGRLFVGDVLLEDSSMRSHPLTPMTESDVRVLLERQSATPVTSIALSTVRAGEDALRAALDAIEAPAAVVIDAVDDRDLATIARASASLRLVTGGSGLALGFDAPADGTGSPAPVAATGPGAIVCGSASSRSQEQVRAFRAAGLPARQVDPDRGPEQVDDLVRWAEARWAEDLERPVLVYATASPDDLVDPGSPGHADRAERIEAVLAETAAGLTAAGATRLVAAGGETSGRVVTTLGVDGLVLTRRIAPGVSWANARTAAGADVSIALKSGNFGDASFFVSAWEALR